MIANTQGRQFCIVYSMLKTFYFNTYCAMYTHTDHTSNDYYDIVTGLRVNSGLGETR